MKKYIAYYRVSTARQGESGLGLTAQQNAVKKYVGNDMLIKEFTEVESGKKNERPQLMAAIEAAKREDAILLVQKIDRLSRNAAFILDLKDSAVKFLAVDNPTANDLTIGFLAILAQDERERISKRTKAALDVKREQVGEWRISNLSSNARSKSLAIRKSNAANNPNTKRATLTIKAYLNAKNEPTIRISEIAKRLNEAGFKTPRGKAFQSVTVSRMIKKIKEQQAA